MTWTIPEGKKRYGESNPQWRGGRTEIRYPAEFNEQLKARVKERDKYQCQFCGKVDSLIVHHLDSNKFNNEINNLITLCIPCHGRLNKLDCELPNINIDAFVPKPIMSIRSFEHRRKKKEKVPLLYDFTIENENSYVVSGILVHNSYVEHGTVRQTAQPYLYPAYFSHEGEVEKRIMAILKKDEK
jgi:hypothetical protein